MPMNDSRVSTESAWPPAKGEMAERIRVYEWTKTPLGPIEDWPPCLRTSVELVLDSPIATILLWGSEHTQIYNDLWRALMGKKHPAALGQPTHECFPEIQDRMSPLYERARLGEAIILQKTLLPIMRNGDVKDAWWNVHYLPVRNDTGRVSGILCTVMEATDNVLAEQERASAVAALRESEERFRALARSGAYVVYRMNADWSEMNALDGRGFLADTSIPSASWLERYILPEDQPSVLAAIDHAIQTKTMFEAEHRVRQADGTVGWTYSRAVPLFSEKGELCEWIGSASDITARKQHEEALHQSIERFSLFAENSTDVLWIIDAETRRLEYLSPSFAAIFGRRREDIWTDDQHWLKLIHPEDRAKARSAIPRAAAGERVMQSYRIIRPFDGAERWLQDTVFPIRDATDRITRIGGIVQDLTDRTRIEQEVRAKRRELSILVENLPQLVWRAVDGGDWTWASPQWSEFTGQSEPSSHGWGWLDPIHPNDRDIARAAWRDAEKLGRFEAEYRLWRRKDGTYRWFQTRATPFYPDDGAAVEWFGTSTDIDDIRRFQEHERILLAELQHRVRNTLAVIRSIVRRTAATSSTLEDYTMHLEGRIDSFARVQSSVTRDPARGVDLEYLVGEELRAVGAKESDTATVKGPKVMMSATAAETMALAVHELSTNAMKYGALTSPRGEIKVRWSLDEEEGVAMLYFQWNESGVRLYAEPRRKGFGTLILTQTVVYELKARSELDFSPTGFSFHMAVPLQRLLVSKQSQISH